MQNFQWCYRNEAANERQTYREPWKGKHTDNHGKANIQRVMERQNTENTKRQTYKEPWKGKHTEIMERQTYRTMERETYREHGKPPSILLLQHFKQINIWHLAVTKTYERALLDCCIDDMNSTMSIRIVGSSVGKNGSFYFSLFHQWCQLWNSRMYTKLI